MMKSNIQPYPISVFWSDEDEAYIAIAPDLEGCSAGGVTAVIALQELQIAMSLWLEAAQQIGKPLPQPSLPEEFWLSTKRGQSYYSAVGSAKHGQAYSLNSPVPLS